uniref:Uncharacterized protein n=1 Tax=Triticum urartu TaxID=4572 RepID=A0A8R7R7B8_TRIUA
MLSRPSLPSLLPPLSSPSRRRRRRHLLRSQPTAKRGRISHGGRQDHHGGHPPHPQVHDQPPARPQAVRARGHPPRPRQRLQGGAQGEARQGVRGQGPQLHLRVQVPHPLRRRQVLRVWSHLRQPRVRQEVRAQVPPHQERSCYKGGEVTKADQGKEKQDQEDPWCEEDQGRRCEEEVRAFAWFRTVSLWQCC